MSSENKKLVAILGGRPYKDSITLRRFLIPPIREKLKQENIDFIIATNNPLSAEQFKQIKNLKVVETSEKLHKDFMARQLEGKGMYFVGRLAEYKYYNMDQAIYSALGLYNRIKSNKNKPYEN